jgi:type 1 fimbria pilin
MKKIVILAVMMFAVALWFGSTVSAQCTPIVDSVTDNCGDLDVNGETIELSDDVHTVTVSSCGEVIKVEVILCASSVDSTKYRVHFDYKDASGNLLSGFDGPDEAECGTRAGTTSDDTIKLHRTRTTGPEENGTVTGSGTTTLVFEVAYEDLEVNASAGNLGGFLEAGDIVYIWVDTHHKGIQDRAPNTDTNGTTDTCSKPQDCGEVIEHTLSAVVVCP